MYTEEDLIPISALQHVLFCPRQYALIHLEQAWEENKFTMEGNILHERVDVEHHESRKTFRQEFALGVRSLEFGLIGKGDLVEIYSTPEGKFSRIIPVEFKRGTDKENDCDRVQLCAQALCLEEMMGIPIPLGQFYYLKDHRRTTVEMTPELRESTVTALEQIREIQKSRKTPHAEYSKKKCGTCSLLEICLPLSAGAGGKSVDKFIEIQLNASRAECLL